MLPSWLTDQRNQQEASAFGLRPLEFVQAALAGFVATFVMDLVGLWQTSVKLPKADGAVMLGAGARRGWGWGLYTHYVVIGVLLGIAYARWFAPLVEAPRLERGAVYGLLTWVAADSMVVPLADPRLGIFFSKTPRPHLVGIRSAAVHLAYSIALTIGYQPAETESQPNRARAGLLRRLL